MAGGGGDSAGEFLLSLLHNKPHSHSHSPLRGSPLHHHFTSLGFHGDEGFIHQKPPPPHNLMFGSLPFPFQNIDQPMLLNDHSLLEPPLNSISNAFNALQHDPRELGGGGSSDGWGQPQKRRPPPGGGGGGIWDSVERRMGNHLGDLSNRIGTISGVDAKAMTFIKEDGRMHRSNLAAHSEISRVQLDDPGSRRNLHAEIVEVENGGRQHQGKVRDELRKEGQQDDGGSRDLDDLGQKIVDLLLLGDESTDKKKNRNAHDKDIRSDSRGQHLLSQRMRNFKRMTRCRSDIYKLNAHFYAIYESLIPPEEEKLKQRQLLTFLEKLVAKEWPHARLYLYGSCASTFGVSKSDIDVCLAIDDADVNKPEVILKLAEILESENLQNVQALTRARVPIVKLMDPVTGISCDICINNLLAVVNTKLLRDYAQIDVRLHELAFIVKHWAKSRGVNETYHGTLSSYAYVLMCIHFLQQRRPAILPCLQEMETTYSVTVDDVRCAFFDKVEKLRGFGSRNRESIAELVWGFFNYWAHCHDYMNDAISVRTGSITSKQSKDWTRRVGNDRHLICIEDPFEISHDLGRVVDKYSIKVLREEFERAAHIMQHAPNPCISLFQPYVAS